MGPRKVDTRGYVNLFVWTFKLDTELMNDIKGCFVQKKTTCHKSTRAITPSKMVQLKWCDDILSSENIIKLLALSFKKWGHDYMVVGF